MSAVLLGSTNSTVKVGASGGLFEQVVSTRDSVKTSSPVSACRSTKEGNGDGI